MKIVWTQQKKNEVCEMIEAWMQKHPASESGEGFMQSDDCLLNVQYLFTDLIDVIKPEVDDES